MKKLLAVFAVVLGFSTVSHADLLVEPYLGYEMGTTKDQDGKIEGTQLGLRLGYASPVIFWAALDGTLGVSAKFKPDSGSDEDAKRTSVYGVVGIDLPILLRGWVGYGFLNEVDLDDTGKLKGTSYKVGVGFTGLPFISLNLEYLDEKFTERGGVDLGTDMTNKSYVLSVSLPLEL
ncbi:outer membrane beta-barrel protein [Bdellovibrio bacteriovorus]|uniref:outer membrane beta-barrel protein n=1 Tax=Bdellovibrio bacteriovorus TaxID=959 RepID=UPI0035A6C52B